MLTCVTAVSLATAIDCRVGLILDGATVTYSDGTVVPCGPRWNKYGDTHHFGGHASESHSLGPNTQITKVEVTSNDHELSGLRMHASDGSSWGELNEDGGWGGTISVTSLEPSPNERIIGFFGHSEYDGGFEGILEFGILTVPNDTSEEIVQLCYEMAELKNTDGNTGPVSNTCAKELLWIITNSLTCRDQAQILDKKSSVEVL
jgi:hypothetical protein